MEANFTVPAITCNVCSGRIRNSLNSMDGINSVDVDLKTQSVKVSYDPELQQPKNISKRISELGYEVMQ